MIIVLDASTVVSAAIKPDGIPEQALFKALAPPNGIVVSQDVAAEYAEVMLRPKFDRFVTVKRRQAILGLVLAAAQRLEPTEPVHECRDSRDDKYLALAFAAGADVIVTGDARHLLPMSPWRGIPILNAAGFLRLG